MKRILFFAAPRDIIQVLKRFEANAPLKFIEMGSLTTPDRAIYLTSAELPNIGVSTHGTAAVSTAYMVSLRDRLNNQSHVTYDNKEESDLWVLALSDNEFSVTLRAAGLWKDVMLLPGTMGTLHDAPEAQQLMKWFLSALKKEKFTKIDLYWVGPQALEMLKAGYRLTGAETAPPEADIRLPISKK